MLSRVPLRNIIALARDPLIRLVMDSDGLCEGDMVQAFTAAATPAHANDAAEAPDANFAPAGLLHRRPDRKARALPISQGHMRIVW
jgi:hypothetical protein